MLIGCLAISGAGIPLVIGLSGYYSKDAILAQLFVLRENGQLNGLFFYIATGGAAITAFYMFRLWYLTFLGVPRDHHVYDHAHESPKVMYVPLVVLATLAVVVGWPVIGLTSLLDQARPMGISDGVKDAMLWTSVAMPAESLSYAPETHETVSLIAFGVAALGFCVATALYWARKPDPALFRRLFAPVYWFLWNKWFFDQVYWFLFVRSVHAIAALVSAIDRVVIDGIANGLAATVRLVSYLDDACDRLLVDRMVNLVAAWTYAIGLRLRSVQTGQLRQYVMAIVIGIVVLFLLVNR
jgi:NADH-quinone oxidoreductase subunit L